LTTVNGVVVGSGLADNDEGGGSQDGGSDGGQDGGSGLDGGGGVCYGEREAEERKKRKEVP
jgi:hypothetical protein